MIWWRNSENIDFEFIEGGIVDIFVDERRQESWNILN